MKKTLLRTNKEISDIYERHHKMVYRVCYAYLKNKSDTEDALQDTFCKLIEKGPAFENEEHEKAWLIRTATNLCKNILRHWWRKKESIDEIYNVSDPNQKKIDYVFQVVMELEEKYKTVVYLYYYEGYNSVEISKILKKPQSSIRHHLSKARSILKERLGDDFDEE